MPRTFVSLACLAVALALVEAHRWNQVTTTPAMLRRRRRARLLTACPPQEAQPHPLTLNAPSIRRRREAGSSLSSSLLVCRIIEPSRA